MKVYNENKTEILEEYDLEKGELKEDSIIIHHDEIEGQEETGHYEIIAEYPNGGKDIEYIIDTPYIEHQDAYDEEEQIQVYIPYSEEYLNDKQEKTELEKLKNLLSSTDYEAIKYAEGWFTEEEYAPIKEYRENLRKQIRAIIDKPTEHNETEEDITVVRYDENNPPPPPSELDTPVPIP